MNLIQQMMCRTNVSKMSGGSKLQRKHLTAGTHGCGGGRSWQAPEKMAPAPRACTTAAPTVKHFRLNIKIGRAV